ncbi:MAG: very short patch repair endonuclease [Ignavibacteria bacterium GWB2_35_12]|nr:MAG: very short patch repair endonuclease [Ignavibacteria bacterium GWA2_35_8]OGU40234.1 MAG: very short patch repair endonuclease [Ignavibacteria bacterium GWB2_35_12]OGU92550.1 MAG: very short patch repair endonuclease [Ignavibacteria bacterium RIFOXYA2_FULL_35_10]OGV23052.1 MAG: very short patch repair endonuclease [Ignavibacteria bacterium RIFOXYC2_FULL_35_21]
MEKLEDNVIRTKIMKANKPKGNKSTELALIYLFKELKLKGWRRKYKLIGSPDFVFLRKKIAIFTDGCFWHGHNCRNVTPKTNTEYWDNKIIENKKRDRRINRILRNKGWIVFRLWECKIKKRKIPKKLREYLLD